MEYNYTKSLTNYSRFSTRLVEIGNVPVGGDTIIKLQSMTNTDTKDVEATVNQIIEILKKGADFVRITTPTLKDIEATKSIRMRLHERGVGDKPLVADIHFNPKVALEAVGIFEKIRINPGNLVDKKLHNKILSEVEYNEELNKIEKVFIPILEKSKRHKTAVRVGTNHGSLSERIMQKYGDSPEGMAEATMEYLRIARKIAFKDIIISLKASNPNVMVYANRLMIRKMYKEGFNFPLHLGVTEAGNAIQGRIKSAVGIGALLIDGIGDTIRVSLTEPPENELPVAFSIANYTSKRKYQIKLPEVPLFFNPFDFEPLITKKILNISYDNPAVVISETYEKIDFGKRKPDFILTDEKYANFYLEKGIKVLLKNKSATGSKEVYPYLSAKDLENYNGEKPVFVEVNYKNITHLFSEKVKKSKAILVLTTITDNIAGEFRFLIYKIRKAGIENPLILKIEKNTKDFDDFVIQTSIDSGLFFIDGLANGLFLNSEKIKDKKQITDIAFGILQATRRRITEPEYIACPGCGRTLFDLEEVVEKIKKATSHLTGLKIAIMGCIVNGIGEMADADFGYVGSVPGYINLYKGKKLIKAKVPENQAVEELVNLIKQYGKWIDA